MLALYLRCDYARAGIPILPVAKGSRDTRQQIRLYSLAPFPTFIAPLVSDMGGAPYAVIATIRDVLLLFYACRVFLSAGGNNFTESQFEQTTGAPAKVLFLYSVLWFFALFSAILVEGFL